MSALRDLVAYAQTGDVVYKRGDSEHPYSRADEAAKEYATLHAENKQLRFELAIKDAAVKRLDEVNAKLRAALEQAQGGLKAANVVLSKYANAENWASHDGHMHHKSMTHPWVLAAMGLRKVAAALEERETDSTYTQESDADPSEERKQR